MDLFFPNPDEERLPPEQVRLLDLRAEPWPDAKRVKVLIEITPFEKRPSLEISLTDASGSQVASANILETMARRLEINLHLRAPAPAGEVYSLSATLYYQKPPTQGGEIDYPAEPLVVDHRQISFSITAV